MKTIHMCYKNICSKAKVETTVYHCYASILTSLYQFDKKLMKHVLGNIYMFKTGIVTLR